MDIITLENIAVDSLLIICADRNIWQSQFIVAYININYKKQVMITSIKSGI